MASADLARYLLAGGLAAVCNYLARFAFSRFLPFEVAVVFAFVVGLGAGFLLMRRYAFGVKSRPTWKQGATYVAVNLLALAQTVLVSSVLLRWVLPMLGVARGAEAIAHACGVAIPVATSYVGHRHFTFRQSVEGRPD